MDGRWVTAGRLLRGQGFEDKPGGVLALPKHKEERQRICWKNSLEDCRENTTSNLKVPRIDLQRARTGSSGGETRE